jgi:hypothetical protein
MRSSSTGGSLCKPNAESAQKRLGRGVFSVTVRCRLKTGRQSGSTLQSEIFNLQYCELYAPEQVIEIMRTDCTCSFSADEDDVEELEDVPLVEFDPVVVDSRVLLERPDSSRPVIST